METFVRIIVVLIGLIIMLSWGAIEGTAKIREEEDEERCKYWELSGDDPYQKDRPPKKLHQNTGQSHGDKLIPEIQEALYVLKTNKYRELKCQKSIKKVIEERLKSAESSAENEYYVHSPYDISGPKPLQQSSTNEDHPSVKNVKKLESDIDVFDLLGNEIANLVNLCSCGSNIITDEVVVQLASLLVGINDSLNLLTTPNIENYDKEESQLYAKLTEFTLKLKEITNESMTTFLAKKIAMI